MKVKQPTLTITLHNQKDVELLTFANSVIALNNQYIEYAGGNRYKKPEHTLFIKEIKSGSIILDIVEQAPPLLPVIAPFLFEFTHYFINSLEYFSGIVSDKPYQYTIIGLNNFKKFLDIVIKNNTINLYFNFGKQTINYTMNSIEASAAQNQCNKEIEFLKETNEFTTIKENVELTLYQARNSNLSNAMVGNLGIIKEITDKPKVLKFANDKVRYNITKGEINPFNYIYSVDVEIILKNENIGYENPTNISEYIILAFHGPIDNSDLFSH